MSKKSYSEKKIIYLTHAMFHLLKDFEIIGKKVDKKPSKIFLFESNFIGWSNFNNLLVESLETENTPKEDNYYLWKKVETYDNEIRLILGKNESRRIKLETLQKAMKRVLVEYSSFPNENTTKLLVIAWIKVGHAKKRRLFQHYLDTVDEEIIIREKVGQILCYRNYLSTTDQDNILSYQEYLDSVFTTGGTINKERNVIFSDILTYVNESIYYVEKFYPVIKSLEHKKVFDHFVYEMRSIERRSSRANNEGQQLHPYLREIKERSFRTEEELLAVSLKTSIGLCLYFSDSGFSDSGKKAVWSTDKARKDILYTLKYAKNINPSLKYTRILLLDTLDDSKYNESELSHLATDIVFLLNHYVDVIIGAKEIAKTIDNDLFNYAVLTDGTIMRAGEGHTEWRIAKLETTHPEYRKLLNNYKAMENETTSNKIIFKHDEYFSRQDWKKCDDNQRITNIVLLELQEKLAQQKEI